MKRILMIMMAMAMVAGTIFLSPIASACDKCKEKAPDSYGDGCVLPDGARANFTIRPETAGIEFLLKDYKDKLYLIAVNPSARGNKATFTFSKPPTTVKVLNETRTIFPQGNSFADDFDGYGVHVYEIQR